MLMHNNKYKQHNMRLLFTLTPSASIAATRLQWIGLLATIYSNYSLNVGVAWGQGYNNYTQDYDIVFILSSLIRLTTISFWDPIQVWLSYMHYSYHAHTKSELTIIQLDQALRLDWELPELTVQLHPHCGGIIRAMMGCNTRTHHNIHNCQRKLMVTNSLQESHCNIDTEVAVIKV